MRHCLQRSAGVHHTHRWCTKCVAALVVLRHCSTPAAGVHHMLLLMLLLNTSRWCTPHAPAHATAQHQPLVYTTCANAGSAGWCGEKSTASGVRSAVAENNMEAMEEVSTITSMPLPFQYVENMSADDYLAAICTSMGVQLCTVPSNGACFFDSIYALLPTVGKAVHSSKSLRAQIVDFFRECAQHQHGLVGERIMPDVWAAMQLKIISSSAQTRMHNKKPKTEGAYFDAVSLLSVWVDGKYCCRWCTPHALLTL